MRKLSAPHNQDDQSCRVGARELGAEMSATDQQRSRLLPDYWTIAELATAADLEEDTVRRAIGDGRLHAKKVGRLRWLVPNVEAEAYIQRYRSSRQSE